MFKILILFMLLVAHTSVHRCNMMIEGVKKGLILYRTHVLGFPSHM